MIRPRLFLLISGFMLVLNCALVKPGINLDAEEETIRKLATDLAASFKRRDMERYLSHLAPDVVIQQEATAPIIGKATLRALFEEYFRMPFTDYVLETRTVVLAASGDLAYSIVATKIVFGETEGPGKATIIWRKSDGQWKAVVINHSLDISGAPWTE